MKDKNTLPGLIDEALIHKCIKGDQKSQNALYKSFAAPMGRLCLRYIKDEDEARDVLIEGSMKVFNNLSKFEYRGKESLEVWIRKIMTNECLMRLRKNRRLTFMTIQEEDHVDYSYIEDDISAEEIFKIVTSLPDGYRTIFNLFVIEGYSHKEIAQMLGITEGTSRSQLTHAREKLKELLKSKGWK